MAACIATAVMMTRGHTEHTRLNSDAASNEPPIRAAMLALVHSRHDTTRHDTTRHDTGLNTTRHDTNHDDTMHDSRFTHDARLHWTVARRMKPAAGTHDTSDTIAA